MEDEAEEIEEEELEEIDEYTDKDYEATYRQRMIEDKIRMMRRRTWMRNCKRKREDIDEYMDEDSKLT